MVATGFTVKSKIPLNPPLIKGDLKPPFLEKEGKGGFSCARVADIGHGRLARWHRLESLCYQGLKPFNFSK
jgi:hypothetical protein